MKETKREEHARLQRRTDELKEEHAALALSRKTFDKAEHDAHNAGLAKHQADLACGWKLCETIRAPVEPSPPPCGLR